MSQLTDSFGGRHDVRPERSNPVDSSRRVLLRSVGRAFGTAAAVAGSSAVLTRPARAVPTVAADVDPGALGAKLISRITYGITAEELTRFNQLGYEGYLEYHLNYTAINDNYAENRLTGAVAGIPAMTTLSLTGEQIYALANPTLQVNELIEALIVRAVYSKRQLFEKMVEFWTDHFNLDVNTGSVAQFKTLDDREVIRANAMGNFGTLLNASARSPAMLYYLNNDLNTVSGPNENYARELLELHTLSPAAGYTQADVIAVSRALTGWTRYGSNATPTNLRMTFRYNDAVHDRGAKTLSPVFNLTGSGPVTLPSNQPPLKDGQDVLDILVRHPATAEFISTKLCRRFIGEDCPASVIATVKAAYLNNGAGVVGDIKAMLRAMLRPNVVYTATPRWKRPFHLFMSMLRAIPVSIMTTGSLRTRLTSAGHRPFSWGPPDGYPDTLEYWGGQQLPRWNFAFELVPTTGLTGGSIGGVTSDIGAMLGGVSSSGEILDRINQYLFRGEMSDATRTRINEYLATTTLTQQYRNESVALALASPDFQWY